MSPKATINPKTLKLGLKVASIALAVATAVFGAWEAGLITDASGLVNTLASALIGALNDQP